MRLKSYPLALLILFPSDVRAQEATSICMEQAQRATLAEHPRPVQQAAKSLPARENHPPTILDHTHVHRFQQQLANFADLW